MHFGLKGWAYARKYLNMEAFNGVGRSTMRMRDISLCMKECQAL